MKQPIKKTKKLAVAHTPRSPQGMGDFYGQGKRNPMGKIRDSYLTPKLGVKKTKTPPKSLA